MDIVTQVREKALPGSNAASKVHTLFQGEVGYVLRPFAEAVEDQRIGAATRFDAGGIDGFHVRNVNNGPDAVATAAGKRPVGNRNGVMVSPDSAKGSFTGIASIEGIPPPIKAAGSKM